MNFLVNWFKQLFKKDNNIVSKENTNNDTAAQTDKDKFEKAMKFVRVVEGGKFFHPNDPGGFTNMGLTQRDYPKLDLKNLTRKQADDIFYKDYWKKSIAGKLPDPAFISYFDAVVNTGTGRANKILQKVLGVEPDGKIGKVTLEALNKYPDSKDLAVKLADSKQSFYEGLVSKNKKFGSFIRGWSRRTRALKEYITTGAFSW